MYVNISDFLQVSIFRLHVVLYKETCCAPQADTVAVLLIHVQIIFNFEKDLNKETDHQTRELNRDEIDFGSRKIHETFNVICRFEK